MGHLIIKNILVENFRFCLFRWKEDNKILIVVQSAKKYDLIDRLVCLRWCGNCEKVDAHFAFSCNLLQIEKCKILVRWEEPFYDRK